jgi:P pilus assembly chaperone PapD
VTGSNVALVRRAAFLAAALGFALCATQGARAAGFQFEPVRVHLTARDRVGSITLTNPNDAPIRLEVQAYHWTQGVDGQSMLNASDALLVFPQLLTIPPHERRSLRVAMTDPPGEREETYKVSIAEIGSFSAPAARGARVSIQMQANLPVYIAPTVERRAEAIAEASVEKRTLSFAVVNAGTVHFVTKDVRITGIGPDTRPLFAQELDDGAVFADGKREYRVDLPRNECGALRALTIQLNADDQPLIQTLDVPAGACNP